MDLTDPVKGRIAAIVTVALGGGLLVFERSQALERHVFHPKVILIGTICLLLGAVGVISPVSAFALSKRAPDAPPVPGIYKAVSVIVMILGAAAGLLLMTQFEQGNLGGR